MSKLESCRFDGPNEKETRWINSLVQFPWPFSTFQPKIKLQPQRHDARGGASDDLWQEKTTITFLVSFAFVMNSRARARKAENSKSLRFEESQRKPLHGKFAAEWMHGQCYVGKERRICGKITSYEYTSLRATWVRRRDFGIQFNGLYHFINNARSQSDLVFVFGVDFVVKERVTVECEWPQPTYFWFRRNHFCQFVL